MIRLVGGTFFKEREVKRKLLSFIARAKQLSFGPECLAFEKKFAVWQGRTYAVFVNSGSSANLALIQALMNLGRLTKGDKVAFSSVTWSTNVMPILSAGLTPVPLDVSLETLNVTPEEVERAILKEKVRAVFITNLLGFSHNLTRIRALCKKHKVVLLEDNCESLGSVEQGKKLGNFGLASTFSFFVGHHLSTIEGGMVATDDAELADMLRIVRAHGWDRHLGKKSQSRLRKKHRIDPFYGVYAFYDIGYNLRPTEINGFVGSLQIALADEIVKRRVQTFTQFQKAVAARSDIFLPLQSEHMDVLSAFALPLICKSQSARKKLVAACTGKIEIRPIVGGSMPHQPFYKKYYPKAHRSKLLQNAAKIHKLGLYLPIHPDMTAKEKKVIVDTLYSV